jgi:hypothetical protein
MANEFRWFDQAPTENDPRKLGALSIIGRGMQGFAAPYMAAYGNNSGYEALKMQQQQDMADMEFQKYLADRQYKNQELDLKKQVLAQGKPVYTIGADGFPMLVGNLPKGSQVIPPTSMLTPEDKIKNEVAKSELVESAKMLPKMDQAFEAVSMLKDQYYKGFTPKSVGKGDVVAGIKSRLSGAGEDLKAGVGASPDLQTFKNNRGAFASLISKGGFLESGVLTDQDIARVLKAIPTEYSTKEEADKGWAAVESILTSARKKYEGKVGKFGSSGKSDYAEQISKAKELGYSDEEIQKYLKGKK